MKDWWINKQLDMKTPKNEIREFIHWWVLTCYKQVKTEWELVPVELKSHLPLLQFNRFSQKKCHTFLLYKIPLKCPSITPLVILMHLHSIHWETGRRPGLHLILFDILSRCVCQACRESVSSKAIPFADITSTWYKQTCIWQPF